MISVEKKGKTIDQAVEAALIELNANRDDVEIEVLSEGVKGIFGIGASDPQIRATLKDTPQIRVKMYLKDVLEKMGIEAQLEVYSEDNEIKVNISGEKMGMVIGRRGDTLDALQHLCSLVANRKGTDYIRVTLDTENYRAKREETLIALAKRMANNALRSRRSIRLEPMNPNERRIIHSTLQEYKNIATYSTGDDPNRCVIISPKRAEYKDREENKTSFENEEA